LPVLAELIVLLSFLRVRKDAVGFVYFLEFLFSILIPRIDVGMMLSCQLPVGRANLVFRSLPGHCQCFVVVLELNCHVFANTKPQPRLGQAARERPSICILAALPSRSCPAHDPQRVGFQRSRESTDQMAYRSFRTSEHLPSREEPAAFDA